MWKLRMFGFEFYDIFFNFILFSFFGWVYESIVVSVMHKKLVNRGFLNGPYLPIYGTGATIIGLFLLPYRTNYIKVFLSGMCIATVLEYVTSYIMEIVFHAKWWDYSHMKFNIHGRIYLGASLLWGILSILVVEVLTPLMGGLIMSIPRAAGQMAGYIILIVFLADLTATVINTLQLDKKLTRLQQLRADINEYFESSKLNGTKEELKTRLEQYKITELLDLIKRRFDDELERLYFKLENKESYDRVSVRAEFENRMNGFINRYKQQSSGLSKIQKRLLTAFPTMKVKDRENALRELKESLILKIQKKRAEENKQDEQ